MKLIMLITAHIEDGLEVANIWQEAGAPGVTIIQSHGLYNLQQKMQRDSMEIPLHIVTSMASTMAYILQNSNYTNHVLLSVVKDEIVDELLKAATNVLGDLMEPDRGIAFVIDLEQAIGIRTYDASEQTD